MTITPISLPPSSARSRLFGAGAGPRRFVGAPSTQPIGKNPTLLKLAPDVITALGPKVTVGQLRDRFGLSPTKIAKLPIAQRAALLGARHKRTPAALLGAGFGVRGGVRKHRATKAPRVKKPARKRPVRRPKRMHAGGAVRKRPAGVRRTVRGTHKPRHVAAKTPR
jgi:hypothetical protein